MRTMWRDVVNSALAILGAVVVFAKLQSYSWWLIGSWTGALGVLAVIGFVMFMVTAYELFSSQDGLGVTEIGLWVVTATYVIASLVVTTTKAEFTASASLLGATWLFQLFRDSWVSSHAERHHYVGA